MLNLLLAFNLFFRYTIILNKMGMICNVFGFNLLFELKNDILLTFEVHVRRFRRL